MPGRPNSLRQSFRCEITARPQFAVARFASAPYPFHLSRVYGRVAFLPKPKCALLLLRRLANRYGMGRVLSSFAASLVLIFLVSCESVPPGIQAAKINMSQSYAAEAPGDYFIGRRYYKPDFKFWGYVRRPGQPWSESQLVMLNEKQKLAPDRERLDFGSDNNYEYKLYGYFSGDKVYEPASNTIYPEFVLRRFVLVSTNPPPIFPSQLSSRSQAEVSRYQIEKPQL